MPLQKSVQQIWDQQPSGLVLPDGTNESLSSFATLTFLQIKEKALALEQLYAESNIPLPPTCYLAQLIAEAKVLSDSWLLGKGSDRIPHALWFRVGYLDCIADAVQPLQYVSNRTPYLTDLTAGSLDCFARAPSKAKDTLWELELWSILRERSFNAVLSEPDIIVVFEDATIGIACKKFYSTRHVQRVLSEAVHQNELPRSKLRGINPPLAYNPCPASLAGESRSWRMDILVP